MRLGYFIIATRGNLSFTTNFHTSGLKIEKKRRKIGRFKNDQTLIENFQSTVKRTKFTQEKNQLTFVSQGH